MRYWLLKTEPTSYSIDDLRRDRKVAWEGVRNYQARNFMQEMEVGDLVLLYHSSTEPLGVFGVAKVVAPAHADESQFKRTDSHFDPKSTKQKPRWQCVDIGFLEKFRAPMLLSAIKSEPALRGMALLAPGSRLSVQPVEKKHFDHIRKAARLLA